MNNIHCDEVKDDFTLYEAIHIKHLTYPTFYRLKIAEILPVYYEKAIYIDTDVIVLKDLTVFYNTDISDYYIAGVKAANYINNTKYQSYYDKIGLADTLSYINAGVILWNLNKIRQDNMTEELCKHINKNYTSADQDLINLVLYGKIKCMPPKFNIMTGYKNGYLGLDEQKFELYKQAYEQEDFTDDIKNPTIILYIGPNKPWKNNNVWLEEYWWEYEKISAQQNIEETDTNSLPV